MNTSAKASCICLIMAMMFGGTNRAKAELPLGMPELPNSDTPTPVEAIRLRAAEASIKNGTENSDKAVHDLIAIARDETLSTVARQQAILLLSKVRNKESLDFLIANVSLDIPTLALSILDDSPCWKALTKGDWNTAKAVLDSLDAAKPRKDLVRLGNVLEVILTRDLAKVVIDHELAKLQNVDNERKKNLTALQRYLQG